MAAQFSGVFSSLAIIILQRSAAHEFASRRTDEPLLAVGIVGRFANWIVRDEEENEIFRTIIEEGVRLFGLENEGVASFDRRRPVLMPGDALSREHIIKFPLRTVGVIRIGKLPRR